MIIRRSNERGFLKTEIIESRRSFSNNTYWNPKYMNWNCIKVINDDILQPNCLVPKHEHINYDILGYIVEGELEHWDSEGNLLHASAGQIQRMWCGKSIWHSEKCVSETPSRYLQIWITPNEMNTKPFYELYDRREEFGDLGIEVKQDIQIKGGIINGEMEFNCKSSYFYVISGQVIGDGFELNERDSVELYDETFSGKFNGHFLMFDYNIY